MAACAPADPDMAGDLAKRTATALALGGTALAATWTGGAAFITFIALLLAALAWEQAAMWGDDGATADRLIVALLPFGAGMALVAAAAALSAGGKPSALLALAALGAATPVLAAGRPFRRLARAATSLLWFAPAAAAAVYLRQAHGFEALVWPVLVVIASDVGAFAVGRAIGGPKLAPRISPSKTWSGLGGGFGAGGVVGIGAALAFGGAMSPNLGFVALAALAVVLAGVAGDLAESALKRRAGVKDSGGLLPGHGGVFDRFDSHLFALPVFALIALAGGWPL